MKFYPSRQNLISALVILCFFLSLVQGTNEEKCNRYLSKWRNNLTPGDFVRYVGVESHLPFDHRDAWVIGSEVEVYSESRGNWWEGKVIDIKKDHEGEWLRVKYQVDAEEWKRQKDIKRWYKNIRQSKVCIKSAPDMTTQKVSIYYTGTQDGNYCNINLTDIYPEGLHPTDEDNEIMLSKWKSFKSEYRQIRREKREQKKARRIRRKKKQAAKAAKKPVNVQEIKNDDEPEEDIFGVGAGNFSDEEDLEQLLKGINTGTKKQMPMFERGSTVVQDGSGGTVQDDTVEDDDLAALGTDSIDINDLLAGLNLKKPTVASNDMDEINAYINSLRRRRLSSRKLTERLLNAQEEESERD